jgi:pyruvate dehydrogenase E2 component (dihydrolipoamide acetyltransferase)
VRKLAKDLGVDLHALTGTADGGVITREDVERAANGTPAVASTVDSGTRERRVPIKGVRKMTAAAMVQSAYTAPHVTEFLTIDVTPMMEFREKLKKSREFAGVKVTPLTFAAKAVCLAVKRTPDVNATWAGDEIVYKDYVHLGIAAATPRGLIVPKVRDADSMSLKELAQALTALTDTAREGKTSPADMANGTITITNVGVFGVDTGTPILNPGESAILAFGAIREMPWVHKGRIVPRQVTQLALSFDHRIIDGELGSRFLADVGAMLHDPGAALAF